MLTGMVSYAEVSPLLALLRRICETPAPTFEETARGRLIHALWQGTGLTPHIDEVGNVVAQVPGRGKHLLLAAHLDTVFDRHTDVTVKTSGDKLCAPGIGDNSASLAVLTHYLYERAGTPHPNLTVAATVGEEGLGDLRGIRHLVARGVFDAVIAIDGHLGTVVHQSVGSRRFEFTLHAKGGHSWGDYPSPSATHALGDMIHAITHIALPAKPRSSLNIGQVQGGTSINAIAETASFNLDMRSLEQQTLDWLEREVFKRVRKVERQHQVTVQSRKVGDRPTGVSDNAWLVAAAQQALESLGQHCRTVASSTDANAAMAQSIPAIAFGVYTGGDAHRLSEWLEPASLTTGYQALTALLRALADA
jgi:acetylornithine deacetylase/succinyl-diaminopimelate desuccinylase-like protein